MKDNLIELAIGVVIFIVGFVMMMGIVAVIVIPIEKKVFQDKIDVCQQAGESCVLTLK